MDRSQTIVCFEEPGNFLKSQLALLATPRNTGFKCYAYFMLTDILLIYLNRA